MNVIFKPFEGEENWPHLVKVPTAPKPCWENKHECCHANRKCKEGECSLRDHDLGSYRSGLSLAKANAAPFRKEDRENLKDLIAEKYSSLQTWQPDPEKIYSIEGKYKIHHWNDFGHSVAILLKEETVKEAEKEESQSQLFVEMFLLYESCNNKLSIVEEQFHITRIK